MSKLLLVEENVPDDLRQYDQWACWRWAKQGDGWTKQPVDPHTGAPASVTDSATWSDFATAVAAARSRALAGIGFVLTPDDPFAGIDLDDAINPDTRRVKPQFAGIVRKLASYTEASPSQQGIRIFVRGELPAGPRRYGSVEMYDRWRFLTVTGWHRHGMPLTIESRPDELLRAYRRHIVKPSQPPRTRRPRRQRSDGQAESADLSLPTYRPLPDEVVLQKARDAANGWKFRQLYDDGDLTVYDGDDSRGDLALCQLLGYWTNHDREQIDRLFRGSALYREKWERDDYRERTITKAIGHD